MLKCKLENKYTLSLKWFRLTSHVCFVVGSGSKRSSYNLADVNGLEMGENSSAWERLQLSISDLELYPEGMLKFCYFWYVLFYPKSMQNRLSVIRSFCTLHVWLRLLFVNFEHTSNKPFRFWLRWRGPSWHGNSPLWFNRAEVRGNPVQARCRLWRGKAGLAQTHEVSQRSGESLCLCHL